MTSPIALSDEQMSAIWAAAMPLDVNARGAFLEDVAKEISRHPILGDGLLHRLIMVIQRRHFDPPDFRVDNCNGKWGGAAMRTKRRTG